MMVKTILRRAAVLAVALTALGAHTAFADDPVFGVDSLTVTSTDDRAGAHPDLTTAFSFTTVNDPVWGDRPVAPFKTVRLSLPAGLVGDAAHVPQCPAAIFGSALISGVCPDETQVGVAVLDVDLVGFGYSTYTFPVFNVAPADDEPASFGFLVIIPGVKMGFRVRPGDGGLDTVIQGVNQGARVRAQALTLWGVPADPSHDGMRASCMDVAGGGPSPGCTRSLSTPRVPLLRNPTACEPMTTKLSVASWTAPGTFVSKQVTTPAPTGCGDVPFAPSVSVTPQATSADAPTGLDVDVQVPQNRDPDALASADVRRAVVTLPEGYSISPSAADGLQTCDAAAVGTGDASAPRCSDASKIGSATIDSPILADPLTGPIYLGPMTAPGHFQVFVVVDGDGVRLKLPGDITADPVTGRLTTTFDQTPQQPFSSFKLHFDGGARAVLASPPTCGTQDASAALTPWSSASATTVTAPVALGGGVCATGGFAPAAAAGVTNPRAGASTGFTLQVARDDRTPALSAISSVTLPAGLVAKVGSVPLCGSAAAAAGTCPAASRVGGVTVAAGPGSHPLRLQGIAYLTEGYRGAPYGLSLVVPAIAGPYDLGTVVVRSAIRVARTDARISVETDPLPQVLGGIPLRLRSIGLTLDRDGFMINPTSCGDAAIGVATASTGGQTATAASRFGLDGCRALKFAPAIKATAQAATKTKGAGLHVALTQGAGQASLKAVQFGLPRQMGVKTTALGTTCLPAQLAADACPAASQVGGASALTPILGQALKGPVFLVQNAGTLPSLVAVLRGGGLTIQLEGATSASKSGRLTTTFGSIPDVPISAFDLDLPYGKRSILSTSKLPCSGASATVRLTGQNGATRSRTIPVSCVKPKAKAKPKSKTTRKSTKA
jgi:hypothetical protein